MLFNNAELLRAGVRIDSIDLGEHADTSGDKLPSAIGFLLSPVEHYTIKTEFDFVSERHGAPVKNTSSGGGCGGVHI